LLGRQVIVQELTRHAQQVGDERAAERVVRLRPLAADGDDVPGAESREVLRHDRLVERQGRLQVLDRLGAGHEALEDANPGRMGEGTEKIALELLQRCHNI
jgi:hypothetical protein